MSKLTRKCPNCGAVMPADVKYCRKCHAKMDSGRVEVLSQPEPEQARPNKRGRGDDALRNLPKPVRPTEYEGQDQAGQDEPFEGREQAQNGFAAAGAYQSVNGKKNARRPRNAAGEDVPRPVSTARGVDDMADTGRNSDRNLWQIITVLAIILVIIIIAIVLVVQLNRPGAQSNASDPYASPNVISSGAPAPSASPTQAAAPTLAPATATPQGLIVADATAIPSPTATAIPALTPTPVPSPSASPVAPANGNTQQNYTTTAVNDTVYISGNGVNIRSGPGTSYQILGSENTGKQLQRTGRTNNGWSQVIYNGQTAYVSETLLTSTQPAGTTNNTSGTTNNNTTANVTEASGTVKVTAASGANLRSGPGTGYNVVTTVPLNTELTRTGVSGDWTRISYQGQNVYISTSLVSDGSSSTGTASGTNTGSSSGTSTNTGVTADSGSVTVTGNGVRIRTGPGTGYQIIGSANSGNVLTVTGKSGNWYQVSYNGQTGYISGDYARKN